MCVCDYVINFGEGRDLQSVPWSERNARLLPSEASPQHQFSHRIEKDNINTVDADPVHLHPEQATGKPETE